ncbi:MAG: peptidylprolyl isomerase [Methanobacteriota archaeon]|nr:MAG: peptidylprolyl isomerase [Euryarchaeota archaeon]
MHRPVLLVALLLAAALLAAGCTGSAPANTTVQPTGDATNMVTQAAGDRVRLETSMGTITIRLYPDMPITAGNFKTLVEKGFYNGVIFHRVMANFMIQGGDPTGTGFGGPGYTIQDEFTDHNKNNRGTLSMANTGYPNTGGSQFFINVVNNNYLDTKHPVFGEVLEGMDVVDRISKVQTDQDDRPLQNVTIISATVV